MAKHNGTVMLAVPKNIWPHFLEFLDVSQSVITDEEFKNLPPREKQTLRFIERTLGKKRAKRFRSRREQHAATKEFFSAIGRV